MSIKTAISTTVINKRPSRKSHLSIIALMSTSLMTGVSVTTLSAQAAGLGELFGNNNVAQAKFLPVGEAFQVGSVTKATSKGTQLSITFDITPGHYVYKNKLTVSFPKGISATPLSFSQSPVTINDPTFGKVPVFTQKNVIATTTLTTNNGKGAKNVPVVIGWQGCAKAGLCYPPEKIKTTVNIGKVRK